MPSRQLTENALPPAPEVLHGRPHHHHHPYFLLLIIILASVLTVLLFLLIVYKRVSKNRTAPSDLKAPCKFSYAILRKATSSFSPVNKLGQGGFGSVYGGALPSGQQIAVKVMETGSLQGEREFHNELSILGEIDSDKIVSLIGFCCDKKNRRLLLVYDFMCNRSLQDALLDQKKPELMEWKTRFSIIIDVALGLQFLHTMSDPPIIHGDVKPSNILLDSSFKAKIADFGLAKVKNESEDKKEGSDINGGVDCGEDNCSIMEETESATTRLEEGNLNENIGSELSPESDIRISPEIVKADASTSEIIEKNSVTEMCFDKSSVDGERKKSAASGKDWWWRQDNGGVKDYVMEWIGTEIKKERPKSDWTETSESTKSMKKNGKKKKHRRLEWWRSLDDDQSKKKDKIRPAREWWKEEFCEELSKKKKRRKEDDLELKWWQIEIEEEEEEKKKRKGRRSWSLNGRNAGAEILHSGVSSTPSMRGTVCYVAPEYCGGVLSEKCDVYSFGVLILVIIAGRRPLQVTASPTAEFERANLISWTRHLARRGKLLDLIDVSIMGLNHEQALLCISVALLCLQRSPSQRPNIKEVVGMLTGAIDAPHLPLEFSPSPPSGFSFKSRKKAR